MTDAEKEARTRLLGAPCLFCDYNGAGYWQVGTHRTHCPWHLIGGETARLALMDNEPRVQRILRFAREYGPELAREAVGQVCVIRDGADIDAFGRWLRGEELTPPLSPAEDTTPAGWTRDTPPAIGGPLREWSPPERGKPL